MLSADGLGLARLGCVVFMYDMLGRADGTDLPWALGSRLPGAFVRTWGAWSAIAVTVDAPAAAG